MDSLSVRDAEPRDLGRVQAIYAHHVLHGVGTFEEEPPDLAEMARRHAAVTGYGLPWLVAEIGGEVAGYAYAGPFRTRSAYRYVVEDSIYVAEPMRGRGVGRALMAELIARCERLGLRQMLGVIGDSGNAGSIALHRAFGFELTAVLPSLGYKHGRWLDVVWMQKALNGGGERPPDGPGLEL
jgi:phosphinothricin acetyltransferase